MSFVNQGKSHFKLLRIRTDTDTDTKAGPQGGSQARSKVKRRQTLIASSASSTTNEAWEMKRTEDDVKDLTDVNGVKDVTWPGSHPFPLRLARAIVCPHLFQFDYIEEHMM